MTTRLIAVRGTNYETQWNRGVGGGGKTRQPSTLLKEEYSKVVYFHENRKF